MVAEPKIRRVAIIDDDISQAEVMGELVSDAGYEPILILGPRFERVEDLVNKVRTSADAAICDHRLQTRGFAEFYGAEAVAALIEIRFPSLLITQYFDIDSDVSIRRWRHRVPVLLSRDHADPESIVQGFNECVREVQGEHIPSRRPWRTLIQVDETDYESGDLVVDAHVASWNPHQAVRFPAALVPPALRSTLAAGVCFFAQVNIGAERAEDLFFFDFEPAPEPAHEDVLFG